MARFKLSLHDLGFLGRRDSSRVLAKVLDIYGLEFFKIPSIFNIRKVKIADPYHNIFGLTRIEDL
jgi:hypothetical protein